MLHVKFKIRLQTQGAIMSRWKDALETKDFSRIKATLKAILSGGNPVEIAEINLSEPVLAKDFLGRDESLQLVTLALRGSGGFDLEMAEQLFLLGAPLPSPRRKR